MPGFSGGPPCHPVLLQGGSATLSGVTITGTSGQFSCTAATLVVGMQVVISGTFGGTGSITGYVNPTAYLISVTNGTTTFTLTTLAGTAIVTTAGTPTGLTYTTLSAIQFSKGVVAGSGSAGDTLIYGFHIIANATAVNVTLQGFIDSNGVQAPIIWTGSTTTDVGPIQFPAPILNEFGVLTATPSVAGKVWLYTGAYNASGTG